MGASRGTPGEIGDDGLSPKILEAGIVSDDDGGFVHKVPGTSEAKLERPHSEIRTRKQERHRGQSSEETPPKTKMSWMAPRRQET